MSFEMKEFIGFVNSRHLSDYMIGGEATILRFVDFGKHISHSLVTHPFRGGCSGSIDLSPSWQPALTNRIWVRNLAWHQACDG